LEVILDSEILFVKRVDMIEIQKILAENIKKYRHTEGLTQIELSEKCQLSTNFIGLIETQKKFPSAKNIEKIAESLGVKSHMLFSLEYQKNEATTILENIESSIEELSTLLISLKESK